MKGITFIGALHTTSIGSITFRSHVEHRSCLYNLTVSSSKGNYAGHDDFCESTSWERPSVGNKIRVRQKIVDKVGQILREMIILSFQTNFSLVLICLPGVVLLVALLCPITSFAFSLAISASRVAILSFVLCKCSLRNKFLSSRSLVYAIMSPKTNVSCESLPLSEPIS